MWDQASQEALALSLRVSVVATVAVVALGTPLAFWVARRRGVLARVLETGASLPLVIPPIVTGYLLLVVLSPRAPVGRWLEALGVQVALDWKGAVVAAMVMAFPIYLVVAKVAFEGCQRELEDAARTLNAGPLRVFTTVVLPSAGPGLLAATALGFARAFGEFGATMMLGGNIPGQTRTLPQAIFTHLVSGHDEAVWAMVCLSTGVGIAAMVISQAVAGRRLRIQR